MQKSNYLAFSLINMFH